MEGKLKEAYLTPPNRSHVGDYTINLEGYSVSSGVHIPQAIVEELQKELGDSWKVENRGTRLEISHATDFSKRDDFVVMEAVEKILKPKGYSLQV